MGLGHGVLAGLDSAPHAQQAVCGGDGADDGVEEQVLQVLGAREGREGEEGDDGDHVAQDCVAAGDDGALVHGQCDCGGAGSRGA